jgi:hypothetical protein
MKGNIQRSILSDKSYLRILHKIRDILSKPDFFPEYREDSKDKRTNCGLCNKDIFNWDKKWKQFKQRCPFDMRKQIYLYTCSIERCYFHCYIFKIVLYEKNGKFNIDKMREMVRERIRITTNKFFL